jgi:hypothetical protein
MSGGLSGLEDGEGDGRAGGVKFGLVDAPEHLRDDKRVTAAMCGFSKRRRLRIQ